MKISNQDLNITSTQLSIGAINNTVAYGHQNSHHTATQTSQNQQMTTYSNRNPPANTSANANATHGSIQNHGQVAPHNHNNSSHGNQSSQGNQQNSNQILQHIPLPHGPPTSTPPKWNRRRSLQPTTLEFQLPPTPNRISTPLQKRTNHLRTTSLPPRQTGIQVTPSRRHSTTSVEGTFPHTTVNGVGLTPATQSILPTNTPQIGNQLETLGGTSNGGQSKDPPYELRSSTNQLSNSNNQNVNHNNHSSNNHANSAHSVNYSNSHNHTHGHTHSHLPSHPNNHISTAHSLSYNNVMTQSNSQSSSNLPNRDLSITGYSYHNQKPRTLQNLHRAHIQKMMNSNYKRPGTPVRHVLIPEKLDSMESSDLTDITESSSIISLNFLDEDGVETSSFLSDTDEILTIMSMESLEPEPMTYHSPSKILKPVHLQNLSLNASPFRKAIRHQNIGNNSFSINRQRIFKNRTLKGPLMESITPSKLLIQGTSKQYSQPENKNPTTQAREIEESESHIDDESEQYENEEDDSETNSSSFKLSQSSSSIQTELHNIIQSESVEDMSKFSDEYYNEQQNDNLSEGFDHLEDLYIYFGYLPPTCKDVKKNIIEKHDSFQDLVRPLLSPLSSSTPQQS